MPVPGGQVVTSTGQTYSQSSGIGNQGSKSSRADIFVVSKVREARDPRGERLFGQLPDVPVDPGIPDRVEVIDIACKPDHSILHEADIGGQALVVLGPVLMGDGEDFSTFYVE